MEDKVVSLGKRMSGAILGCPRCGGFPALDAGMAAARIHCTSCGHSLIHNGQQDAVLKWNEGRDSHYVVTPDMLTKEMMKDAGPARHIKLTLCGNPDLDRGLRDGDSDRTRLDDAEGLSGVRQDADHDSSD